MGEKEGRCQQGVCKGQKGEGWVVRVRFRVVRVIIVQMTSQASKEYWQPIKVIS